MKKPRNRRAKQPAPVAFDPGFLLALLYDDLVEVEALAVTADEAVTNLPPKPRGKYGLTMAREHSQALASAPSTLTDRSQSVNASMGMSMLRDSPKMYFQLISVFRPLCAGTVYGRFPGFVNRQLCFPPPCSRTQPLRVATLATSLKRRGPLPPKDVYAAA